MTNAHVDDARRRVWIAFADHFLDTETRQDLPRAALAAVEGGFSIEEAREIWRYEVTPVVGNNLWDSFGEWAGWPTDWLVQRCQAARTFRSPFPRWLRYPNYRLTVHFNHASWVAIERCMEVLYAVDPDSRRALAADLCALAEHYFDFCPRSLGAPNPGRREALRRTYQQVFLPIFRRVLLWAGGDRPRIAAARVEKALAAP